MTPNSAATKNKHSREKHVRHTGTGEPSRHPPRQQAKARGNSTAPRLRRPRDQLSGPRLKTNQVANGLMAIGVKPDERIGYLGKNSDVYFELLLGAIKASGDGAGELAAGRRRSPTSSTIARRRCCSSAPNSSSWSRRSSRKPDRAELIAMEGGVPDWPDYTTGATRRRRRPDGADQAEGHRVQLYTSGTTGRPRARC